MFEEKTNEFKREYMDDIKYAVVAFANTNGGTIYIGVNDDGSIQGVEDADGTMLRMTNMIRDVIRPEGVYGAILSPGFRNSNSQYDKRNKR